MAEEKSTASGSKTANEKPAAEAPEDGVFDGEVRYDGTVLVDREIDGEIVTVMTDKPRRGDKIQAHELNVETGKLEPSKRDSTATGAAPPKR